MNDKKAESYMAANASDSRSPVLGGEGSGKRRNREALNVCAATTQVEDRKGAKTQSGRKEMRGGFERPETTSRIISGFSLRSLCAFAPLRFPGFTLRATACCLLLCLCAADAPIPTSYSNDFEKTPVGKPPEELMLLNGEFAVVQVDGNKCLELTPDPIDGDGLLFGPPGVVTGTVSARIWAAASGKRFPEFGVGASDAGGYKLIVVPAQGTIELRKGDEAKISAPFTWKSDTWTRLKLRISKAADGKFQIEGKAWPDGSPEPQAWMISTQDADAPSPGRASVWGMPYSEKPIRFDDLAVNL